MKKVSVFFLLASVLILVGIFFLTPNQEDTVNEPSNIQEVGNNLIADEEITMGTGLDQETNEFSLTDISTHDQQEDCWMAIGGKVYDATPWIPNHPGGLIILKGCGIDATSLFQPVSHSANAQAKLKELYIGELI